jgi:hypothetical protein
MSLYKTNTGVLTLTAIVAGVVAFGLTGTADAHVMKKMASPAAATEQAPMGSPLDQAIRGSNGSDFAIISEAQLKNGDAAVIQETTSDAKLDAIHAAISANPTLAHKLTAQNVEVKEITGAVRAADGSLVFYTM